MRASYAMCRHASDHVSPSFHHRYSPFVNITTVAGALSPYDRIAEFTATKNSVCITYRDGATRALFYVQHRFPLPAFDCFRNSHSLALQHLERLGE